MSAWPINPPSSGTLAFSLRLATYCRSCPCDRHDLFLPSIPASLNFVYGDSLSWSAASGSPVLSYPEFSHESTSSASESGVTRTGSNEAVMRKRMLLRSSMRCTVSPSSSCIVQMSLAERGQCRYPATRLQELGHPASHSPPGDDL
jgi:hypothetical protein